MAFKVTRPTKNFCIGFTKTPRYDFGVYAKGYLVAANKLAASVLRQRRFSDNEAYPIVFLYRHSLELQLKNIIYKAVELSAYRTIERLDATLYNNHKLVPLAEKTQSILASLFPNDRNIIGIGTQVVDVAMSMDAIDHSSYTYRYPIKKDGKPIVSKCQTVNLHGFSNELRQVLKKLEVIDFGINIETDIAKRLVTILNAP